MTTQFTHLHVHTEYSLLDGMSTVSGLVEKCLRSGMNAMAVTDHGNMFGIKEFFNFVDKKNKECQSEIDELEKAMLEMTGENDRRQQQERIAQARSRIFKPIFGCEAYVARQTKSNPTGSRLVRENKENYSGCHLILLAKNEKGYHSLCKLISYAWIEGRYVKPRIDHELLEKYHEGLIVSSACLAGEVPRALLNNDYEKAKKTVEWYKNLFGDDYYLELQRHKTDKPGGDTSVYEQQGIVNQGILRLSAETGVKVIATNDVHFVEEDDAEAHDRLICLSTGKKLNDADRLHYTKQEWLKSPEEMAELFADLPEALSNTQEIVDKVETYKLKHDPIMPVFDIPEEFGTIQSYKERFSEEDLKKEFEPDEEGQGRIEKLGGYERVYRIKLEADYLRELTLEGAHLRYGETLADEVQERIDFELSVMRNMGFPGYFLIVYDFIDAARKMGVSVGPGRGSAAGSVVAYCLGITNIDPLKYDLLFERFLNPDRISLPDIDVDFDDEGRYRILDWITKKYGEQRVAHIITYGTMAAKSSIKDVARVQDLDLKESIELTKLIPDKFPEDPKTHKAPKVSIKNCLELVPELREHYEHGSRNEQDVLKYAAKLEGTVRQIGVHPCGIIIGADDLTNFVPMAAIEDKGTKQDVLVTQYEGSVIEDVGLIKMDFLGLKTLSIINEALKNIKKSKGIDLDIDAIPIDDPETYELFCNGDTVATFQFESPGMQKYLKELKPSKFEDIIAMNALYRPGPMDYIPQFIRRKQGREEIRYDIPIMERYLKDTYGITVYQEQVMLLSRLLANFTRGESDTLRKAMGKKQKAMLDKLKPKFIEQGSANGHDPKILEKIWGDWEKFASYAFNKSHATCYSWVAYQTAYLKAHHPAEFMAANMTNNLDNIAEISNLIENVQRKNIKVLGPDINESDTTFTVNKQGNIRFGLAALKGVGASAVDCIIAERNEHGPYTDIFDFITRINIRNCNKRCIEALAMAGSFDSFRDMHRAQFFYEDKPGHNFVDILIAFAGKKHNDQNQFTIFDMDTSIKEDINPVIPECEPWSTYEQVKNEKEIAGFYISAHPLDEFKHIIQSYANVNLAQLGRPEEMLKKFPGNKRFSFVGIVTDIKRGVTANNKDYGNITLEEYDNTWKWYLSGEDFTKYSHFFDKGKRLFISAILDVKHWRNKDGTETTRTDVKPVQVLFLEDVYEKHCKEVRIVIGVQDLSMELSHELKRQIGDNSGDTPFCLRILENNGVYYSDFADHKTKVNPEKFLNNLNLPVNYSVELN